MQFPFEKQPFEKELTPSPQEWQAGERQETSEKKEKEQEKELFEEQEKAIRKELERKIAATKWSAQLQDEVKKSARSLKAQDIQGRASRLLALAQEKGVTFALAVAKRMQDEYLLDLFHDLLVKNEGYKKFPK